MLLAAKDLELIEDELLCTIHIGKADAVASSGPVLDQLRRMLGPLKGQGAGHSVKLGISIASGQKRGSFWKKSIQSQRRVHCHKRVQRIMRMRQASSCRAIKLMKAGAATGLVYGAQVYGLSDAEDLGLRRMVAAAHSGSSKGRSLCCTTALFGEVSWRGTAAPLQQWATEVWRSASSPAHGSRHLSLPRLRELWQTGLPFTPTKWSVVRGPVGAGHLCIRRLGWSWPSPFVWITDKGQQLKLTEHSPRMLAEEIRLAYRRKHEGLAAGTLGCSFDEVT